MAPLWPLSFPMSTEKNTGCDGTKEGFFSLTSTGAPPEPRALFLRTCTVCETFVLFDVVTSSKLPRRYSGVKPRTSSVQRDLYLGWNWISIPQTQNPKLWTHVCLCPNLHRFWGFFASSLPELRLANTNRDLWTQQPAASLTKAASCMSELL